MRHPPAHQYSSEHTFWHWNSPLPYLFLGLGLMIFLIAAALIILACSFRKRRDDQAGEKAPPPCATAIVVDNTPKIVVIMAGDENPTRLAVPIPNSSASSSGVCV